MATQEMILKLSFDDEGTFTGLDEINQELNKVDESTNKVNTSTQSLKAQYRQLNQELVKFDPGTEKYTEISQKMGEIKDRMNDASDAVRANTGPAFESMGNTFSIMRDQISNLDFEGLGQSLTMMATNIKRIDFKMFKDGIKSMITGLKNLTAAMISNPVTLLFVILAAAIALVATNWKDFASLFKGETTVLNSLKKELGSLEAQNAAIKNKITYAKIYGDSLYQQYKLSQQLLENEIEQERVKMRIALIQDESEEAETARTKIIELQNKQLVEQTQHIVDYYNVIKDAVLLTNADSKLQNEKNEAAKKYNSALEETRAKLAQLRADSKLSLSGVGNAFDISVYEDNEKKLLGAIDKSNAEVDKKYREEQKAILDARRDFEIQLRNEIFKSTATQDDYELEMLRQQYTKKLEEAKKNKANLKLVEEWYNNAIIELLTSQAQRESDLEDAKNKKKLDEQKAYNDAVLNSIAELADREGVIDEEIYNAGLSAQDLELKTVREHYLALIAEAEFFKRDSQALKDQQLKEELAITKKYADAEAQLRVDTVAQGLSALTALNESFTARTEKTAKRQFNVNKALNIAMSLVDTYSAIVKALNSPETIPTSIKIAQAVAVGVMGFANVAKIAKTQFGGGAPNTSMDQGAGATTTQSNAPAIDFSGGNFNNNAPGTVETYVLAGNVANALEARQKIIDQSHL